MKPWVLAAVVVLLAGCLDRELIPGPSDCFHVNTQPDQGCLKPGEAPPQPSCGQGIDPSDRQNRPIATNMTLPLRSGSQPVDVTFGVLDTPVDTGPAPLYTPTIPDVFNHTGRLLEWTVDTSNGDAIVGRADADTVTVRIAHAGSHSVAYHLSCYAEPHPGWRPQLEVQRNEFVSFVSYSEWNASLRPSQRISDVLAFDVYADARVAVLTVTPVAGASITGVPRFMDPDGFIVNTTHNAYDQFAFVPSQPGPWKLQWDAQDRLDPVQFQLRVNYCDGGCRAGIRF